MATASRKKAPTHPIIYSYVVPGSDKIRFTNDPVNGADAERDAAPTTAKVAYGYTYSGFIYPSCHSQANAQRMWDHQRFKPMEEKDQSVFLWLANQL